MPVPSTNWKEASDPNAGSSVIYGAPDVKKISQLFNGDVDVDDVDINSEFFIRDGKLHIVNPAGDFTYIVQSSAITADRDVTLPVLTGNDEITFNAQAQNLTNKGIDISAILGLPISAEVISTDSISATSTAIEVEAESASVDDLSSITGLANDDVVALYAKVGETITLKHNASPSADQFFLQGGVDVTLSETVPVLCVRKGGVFTQFAGSGSTTFLDNLFALQDEGDTTKQVVFSLAGTTTAKTLTLVSSVTDNRSLTFPDATDTLVGKATSDVFTNKSYDADGTGNVLTNVDNANIKASAGIVPSKIAVADGDIIIGDGSGEGQAVTMSGDGTISNTGVFSLDPVRFSSLGDRLQLINTDRNHNDYLVVTPQSKDQQTPVNVLPAHTTLLQGWWANSYGMEESVITPANFTENRFEAGVAHTTSPSTQDGWLTNDHTAFTIDAVNDRMTCQTLGDSSNDGVSFDFGSDRSNSTWTCRFRTMITAKADSSAGGRIFIGLSNQDSSAGSNGTHDAIGFWIENSASTTYAVNSVEANEQTLIAVAPEDTYNVVMELNKWYYWEIIRTATTSFTTQFFGLDRNYLRPTGALTTTTISSAIDNMRYWLICNDESLSDTGDRTMQFDMMSFWNADSDIQHVENNGTIGQIDAQIAQAVNDFWVSDTTKPTKTGGIKPQIIFGHARPLMVENFTEYEDDDEAHIRWLAQDSAKIDVDVTNKRINFNCVNDLSNDALSFPLGNNGIGTAVGVSAIEWEMRFKLTIDSHFANTTNDAELFIGLRDGDSSSGADVAKDFMGVKITHGSTISDIGCVQIDAGILNALGDTVSVSGYSLGTTYYVRLYRNTATNYGISIYSDPDYKIRTHNNNSIGATALNAVNTYFGLWNRNSISSDSTIQGKIEDIQVWTDGNFGLNNALGSSGAGLRDMHFDPVGFAIHMNTANTSETQIKIRTNITGNLFFTDADNVRTVDIADFSDKTFRFLNMNRVLEGNLETPTAWIQIEGVTPNSSIHINRIMYRRFYRIDAHFHHRIDPDVVENTWDADDPDGVRTTM